MSAERINAGFAAVILGSRAPGAWWSDKARLNRIP